VHVQVLSVLSQTVRGVGVGGIVGGELTTDVPGPGPDRETELFPFHQVTSSVQNRRVEAILTTEDGKTYYVVLGCQKQYGWCAPLAEHTNYVGNLNNQPKWLADYPNWPYGLIKVLLRPDGKKKVTYQIEYAAEVKVLKP